jgi:TM2 domain-containing membrane protein YozV
MNAAVCPYCRMPFDEASPPQIFCTACGMPHHEDCYRENGGCTVFGCKCAPADDPKLQVSQSDLQSVPMQPYAPSAQQYVPASAYVPPQPYRPSAYSGPLGLSQAAAPAPVQSPGMSAPASAPYTYGPAVPVGYQYGAYGQPRKSRSTYIVLGIFLGALGVHNFYAGYVGRGVGQLCLSIFTLGYLGVISWIWAIIEICIVEKDSTGQNFS